MSRFEEDLKIVINAMADSFTKDTMERNHDVVSIIKTVYDANPKRFFDTVQCAKTEFDTILEQIVDIPMQENRYILNFVMNGEYERFFNKLMEKKEGSIYCADKSRFIHSMTLKALRTKTNISLYDDYTECEQIKEDKERQAYWSPKTIPDTDTAMKIFWDWYLLREN